MQSVAELCRGAGVDGLILRRFSASADAAMVYFNCDGSQAPMCGNGLRCFVHFLRGQGMKKSHYVVEIAGRRMMAQWSGSKVSTFLPKAEILFWGVQLRGYPLYVVDTTVPHAVIFVQDPIDVLKEGMALCHDALFDPGGVNINFVWVESESTLIVRTYERGVERETLACATGCAAAAFVAHRLGHTGKKPEAIVRSGERLQVELADGIVLSGPVKKLSD